MKLTDHDRQVIAQARELAALGGIDTIKAYTLGEDDTLEAVLLTLRRAQTLLARLADLAEAEEKPRLGLCRGIPQDRWPRQGTIPGADIKANGFVAAPRPGVG
jgi:hypothetical protein